jgi:ADP-ribose pyrophosphatase
MKPDSSQTVYHGKKIGVTVERWGEHDGEIVEHPGAVAIVAIDREGMLTLVRQLREAVRTELLELPAGTLEEGEAPLACARRELQEETGLTGGTWRQVTAFYTTPGFSRERMHLFFAEELEVVRWPRAEMVANLDEIEDAKTLAGLLLYLRHSEADDVHKVG